jgi:leucyl/phenylalanyl-tRNA--protein transferase
VLQWDYPLIDCQVSNPHLSSLGAVELPRDEFIAKIEWNAQQPTRQGTWSFDIDPIA